MDCDETFNPVVNYATIRNVLSITMGKKWPIYQLNFKNAFLHGALKESVYMHQPPGFVDPSAPTYVCHLRKSCYGLKEAPRAWYPRFAQFLLHLGFVRSRSGTSLFMYHHGAYLLLYVDDIVLSAYSNHLKHCISNLLKYEFSMTDLGQLSYFLGILVQHTANVIFLCQKKYDEDIIHRAKMRNCIVPTLVDVKSKLSAKDGAPVLDPSLYCSLARSL